MAKWLVSEPQDARAPIGGPTAMGSAIAWALDRKGVIPWWAADVVLLIAVPVLAWSLWSYIRRLGDLARLHVRLPVYIPMAESPDEPRPSNFIPLDSKEWGTKEIGDGRVAAFMRGNLRILEYDAFQFYSAIRPTEREIIQRFWHKRRRPLHFTKNELIDIVPVYIDPEGTQWRRGEIAEYTENQKHRIQNERPDVWAFFNNS